MIVDTRIIGADLETVGIWFLCGHFLAITPRELDTLAALADMMTKVHGGYRAFAVCPRCPSFEHIARRAIA